MANKAPQAYPPELRHKVLELTRSARSVAKISRQFDVSGQTIMNWQSKMMLILFVDQTF